MAAITFLVYRDHHIETGIAFRYQLSSSIFKLGRLKALTRTHIVIYNMQYADDAGYLYMNAISVQSNINVVLDVVLELTLKEDLSSTPIRPK